MFSRKTACVLIPLVLAAVVVVVWWIRAPRVNASLYDLIGKEADRIPSFLREASASEVAIIVSSAEAAKAHRTAQRLAEKFPAAIDLPPGAQAFIRENRGGLVTRETAELLRTREGRAKLAKRAVRRLYASPFPPLLGYEDDPFGLTDAWLLSLGATRVAKTQEGWSCIRTNGVSRILFKHRLDCATARDLEATIAILKRLEDEARSLTTAEVDVRLAGVPVHAATAAWTSKGEIGALTWFSLAVIAALALFVFRSIRWLPLLTSSLLVSALAGALALEMLFREIHVMTLVMGTTVLGLVIDYSFHWLLSPDEEKARVRRSLLASFLTTEISLVPLMLASIPVLRQSAVFLGSALAAALGYVLSCYPRGERSVMDGRGENVGAQKPPVVSRLTSASVSRLVFHVLSAALLCLALAGLFRVTFKTDVRALYRPSAALAEAERQRAQFGEFDFSALPSLEERRKNATLVRTLYGEHAAEMKRVLGVDSLAVPLEPTRQLAHPQTLMNEIFGAWTAESLRRLACSILVLVGVVACFFRARAVRVLAPSVLALFAVAGLLGWMNAPVNLFHVLAAFLLIGMGVDYAVFLHSGGRGVMCPALSSLLTSMAGFGALAFVSFPVVRSFGVVLGVGLPVAFASALLVRPGVPSRAARETTEHGATLLGMESLFLLYRVFGLRVLHLLAAAVGVCVWACSPAVRRTSPSVRKIILFTRSLADKFVVLADGRDLPQVEADGSADAAAFLGDVRSGKGVFILSTHIGTIEVLTALGVCAQTFHAWMDFDRTSVFNRFYLRHAQRPRVKIHPISEFGMQTVFEAGDWIDSGDCLVMAGDRGEGAFRFAAAFDHPVYFVACLAEGGSRYRTVIRRLPDARPAMQAAYEALRGNLAAAYPDQTFDWGI